MLVKAAADGDLDRVRELIKAERASMNDALISAVVRGHLAVTRFLLEEGAKATTHADGRTPLFMGLSEGLPMIRLLHQFGADVRFRNANGLDLLGYYLLLHPAHAREKADVEAVKYLLDAGAPVRNGEKGHLPDALRTGNVQIVELLLQRGAAPNDKEVLSSARLSDNAGQLLAALVQGGIDANTREKGPYADTTILIEVCSHGDVKSAMTLLDRGADPNLTGRTSPLARATASGNQALVDLLLERGARPLNAPLPTEVTGALDAAEREARARPEDANARLTWAKTLHANGFLAAAACEAEVLRLRGVETPPELSSVEKAGVRWTFTDLPDQRGPAPRTVDARFPRAKVTDGTRTVPLDLALSEPCTSCDEKGEEVCSDCDGTSTHLEPDDFGGYREEWCNPRQHCSNCYGLKFKVIANRFSYGGCKHDQLEDELRLGNYLFQRCRVCGLAALYGETKWRYRSDHDFACGVCGRFACTCEVTRS